MRACSAAVYLNLVDPNRHALLATAPYAAMLAPIELKKQGIISDEDQILRLTVHRSEDVRDLNVFDH